jgi:hypothetical protein
MDYDKLYQAFYTASKRAIEETGDAYKQLSWFGRNKRKLAESEAQQKEAA